MKRIYISLLLALMALPMLAQTSSIEDLRINSPMRQYHFAYIIPSGEALSIGSSVGVAVGGGLAVGSGSSSSISTTDVIGAKLIERDIVRLPSIDANIASETMVISHGTVNVEQGLFGNRVMVKIQVTDAQSHALLCSVKASGYGENTAAATITALEAGMRVILHIPSCATPEEIAELSLALGGDKIYPKFWPETRLLDLNKYMDSWANTVGAGYLSSTQLEAYHEAMVFVIENPTNDNVYRLSFIANGLSKLRPGKKSDKLDKRLQKTARGYRFDVLYSWGYLQ